MGWSFYVTNNYSSLSKTRIPSFCRCHFFHRQHWSLLNPMVVKTLMLQLLHLQYFFWSTPVPQYVLSTIINDPFALLKKEIIFPLLPNNIYFHHHYFFPLFHPQYFLDSTINISLAPPSTSNAITFQFPFHWVQLSPDWWTVIVCFRGRPVNISA